MNSPNSVLEYQITIDILAHFGYSPMIVSDNVETFKSDEFQEQEKRNHSLDQGTILSRH